MSQLTLFEALFVTHLVMDWIFQGHWEATSKASNWRALLRHCVIYTLGFLPAFFFYHLNVVWLLFIFLSHVVSDRRSLEVRILNYVKGVKEDELPDHLWTILLTAVDQTLHLFVLAVIVLFL